MTVTWSWPEDEKVHESVALPELVMLLGAIVQAVLLLERLTVPLNPLLAVTVIVDVPAEPAFAFTLVGLAMMV